MKPATTTATATLALLLAGCRPDSPVPEIPNPEDATSTGLDSDAASELDAGLESESGTDSAGGQSGAPPEPTCGNGEVEGEEDCDGDDLDGQSCFELEHGEGQLGCTDQCTFDVTECGRCGDGTIDPWEDCDGDNLDGQSCVTQGFGRGSLSCDPMDCRFDDSMCEP